MSPQMTKRHFVKESMLMTAGAALGVSGRALGADARQPIVPKATLPMGKIGDISISRLILGGNIMTAYAHARGLRYVKDLMRRYHTPEKILETLRIAEEHGINMLVVPARHIGDVLQRYRHEVGGKMQYMIYSVPNPSDPEHELDGFKEAIDKGADITYIHGDPGYRLIKAGKVDSFKRAVEFAKDHGLQVGVSAHYLEVIRACEEAKIGADFYLKTFHGNKYGSAPRPGEAGSPGSELNDGAFDNSWCRDPREVAEYMRSINKPWIAFKVMAAGAIPPREGFTHAFSNGADFVLAGMFDWQIEEDTSIAREVIASVERPYPWRA